MNLQALIARTRGLIATPDATLAEHGNPPPPVRVVMREHLLPLLALTSLGAFLILLLFAPAESGFEDAPGITALILVARIGINVIGVWITATIIRFHAKRLGGSDDPRAGFVLAALALSPLFVAEMLAPLLELLVPVAGLILLAGAAIYAPVLIYRGNGIVLGVPEAARGRHIAGTVLTMIFLSFLLWVLAAMLVMPGMPA